MTKDEYEAAVKQEMEKSLGVLFEFDIANKLRYARRVGLTPAEAAFYIASGKFDKEEE